ncbi:MAG: hypothetical protein ACREO4_00465 [Lysobacter sp.]
MVAFVHALLGLGLIRMLAIKRAPEPDSTLQLVWISVPATPASPARPIPADNATDPASSRARPAAAPPKTEVSGAVAGVASSTDPIEAQPGSLSAVFVDQARQWARQQEPMEFGTVAPFDRKSIDLPGQPTRLKIRERLTVADAVGIVGQWFGGAGYTTDPCPELRKDVNDLSLAGDSDALQDALYYEKRACH